MSGKRDQATAEALRAAVDQTSGCIELERLDGPLSDADQAHLHTCPRCQAELALLNQFHSSAPTPDEGAAVQWIVSEVRRRRAALASGGGLRKIRFGGLTWRPLGLTAAALSAVVIVAYVARDREPQLVDDSSMSVGYRTEQLSVISPVGDLEAAPSEFRWVAVPGATRYDVLILQVDRTPLWRASVPAPAVRLPASLIAQFTPGRSLIWQVSAVDASDKVIAVSGAQRFRVTP